MCRAAAAGAFHFHIPPVAATAAVGHLVVASVFGPSMSGSGKATEVGHIAF